MLNTNKFLVSDIIKQLKADLIGKDSYRGVTLTYSWLANQFGHFSLGFIPTLIIHLFLKKTSLNNPSLWAGVIVAISWFLFETYNFLGPLLFNKQTKSKFLFAPANKFVFNPSWGNIAFDTFTDLLFFWLGAFGASFFIETSSIVVFIIILDILLLLYPTVYWYVTKMYIQYARLPIQFRLSQWEGSLSEEYKTTILNYISKATKSNGNHLIIYGGRRSGKSPMAIGIATELSINKIYSIYYTGIKLYNLFSLTDQEIKETEKNEKWSWRTSSLLVIDDINPGSPILDNLITPDQLLKIIDTNIIGINNRKDLSQKNVIWVLGDFGVNKILNWEKMIQQIGVPKNQISYVNLSHSLT